MFCCFFERSVITAVGEGEPREKVMRDMEVDVAGGFMAKVRLLLPPNVDEEKKYPLVIEVYGALTPRMWKGHSMFNEEPI